MLKQLAQKLLPLSEKNEKIKFTKQINYSRDCQNWAHLKTHLESTTEMALAWNLLPSFLI